MEFQQGFFLLENFVIQKREGDFEGIKHRSDADLLAIRFPNVVEVIKDKPLECDGNNLFWRTMFDKNRILALQNDFHLNPSLVSFEQGFSDRGRFI